MGKYLDIVNSHSFSGDAFVGKALETVKSRDDTTYHNGMNDDDIKDVLKRREDQDALMDIGRQLVDAVNHNSADDVAKALFLAVADSHRTLQQSAVRAMVKFFEIYQGTRYDARNQCAVAASAVITQVVKDVSIGFPLI